MFESLPSRRLLSVTALPADFNGDGVVDRQDLAVLSAHFGHTGEHSDGDANGDGDIDSQDFDALAGEFGSTSHGKLIFSDEFIRHKLDPIWTRSQYWWPDDHSTIGKDELESYDSTALSLSDGLLHITARKQTKYGEPYVSGLVQTGGKQDHPDRPTFSFLYGYLEVRAKLPAGQGLWPAIWLMPASHDDGNGELDVMEMLGNDPSTVHFTAHRDGSEEGHTFSGPDFSSGFHTFGVDWEPDHITWYVDGVARATCTDRSLICDEASYPILNLAVGGNWPGNPDATTPFPATMDVDYVRVYQDS